MNMNKLLIIVSGIILLVLCVVFLNNKSDQSTSNNSKDTDIVEQKQKILSAEIESINGQLIDVREPEEYKENHADNAINVPLGDILDNDLSKIDNTRPIYLYCRSGVRAEKARISLEKAGYKNVINLGGLSNWIAKEGKTCSTSNPSC